MKFVHTNSRNVHMLTLFDQQKFFGYTEEEVHKKVCMHLMISELNRMPRS